MSTSPHDVEFIQGDILAVRLAGSRLCNDVESTRVDLKETAGVKQAVTDRNTGTTLFVTFDEGISHEFALKRVHRVLADKGSWVDLINGSALGTPDALHDREVGRAMLALDRDRRRAGEEGADEGEE